MDPLVSERGYICRDRAGLGSGLGAVGAGIRNGSVGISFEWRDIQGNEDQCLCDSVRITRGSYHAGIPTETPGQIIVS